MGIFKKINKKAVVKLSIVLVCLVAIALPVIMVMVNPTEVNAAFSDIRAGMLACTSTEKALAYLQENETEIKGFTDSNLRTLRTEFKKQNEKTVANGGWGRSDGYQPYKDGDALLAEYYQDDYLGGSGTGSTISSGTHTYYCGSSSAYKGVHENGFNITGGTVNLKLSSDFFFICGKITLSGGTLNISFADNYSGTGSVIKREVEASLRVDGKGILGTHKYDVDANGNKTNYVFTEKTDGYFTEQYAGEFIRVTGGTLNINGTESRPMTFNGAGPFTANSNATTLSDGKESPEVFPYYSGGKMADDCVESNAPLIVIKDENGNTKVNINYAQFYNNYNNGKDGLGGGIWIYDQSPIVTIKNTKFSTLFARNSGSFMQLSTDIGGSLTMNNVEVTGCVARAESSTAGGTLRTYGSNMCTATFTECKFNNNWAKNQATITWASVRAGAIVLDNCEISNNISYEGSAGISCSGRMELKNGTKVNYNNAVTGSGGGVLLTTWASNSYSPNFEILLDSSLDLDSTVQIVGNKASLYGGGIYVKATVIAVKNDGTGTGYTYYPVKSNREIYKMNLDIKGATITGNTASYGAAIYIQKVNSPGLGEEVGLGSSSDLSDAQNNAFTKNPETDNNSNALYEMNINLYSGNISNNTSTYDGGAIYIADHKGSGTAPSFNMSGGTVSGNKAGTSSFCGGGAYITGGGSFNMSGGTIIGNSASSGGGVYVNNGNFTITNPTDDELAELSNLGLTHVAPIITSNTATYYGGGAYVNNGTFTMDCGTISDNSAADDGGGAFVGGGNFNMNDGVISGNKSLGYTNSNGSWVDGNAGGVAVGDGGSFYMKNGTITENVSQGTGGAVFVNGGSFEMKDGIVTLNESLGDSAGAIRVNNGSFTVSGGEISYNTAAVSGGAGFVSGTDGAFVMTGGYIIGNEALGGEGGAILTQGGSSVTVSGGELHDNYSAQGGGAIAVQGGSFVMTSGNIYDNASGSFGGAVLVQDYTDEDDVTYNASVIIGVENCFGDNEIENHISCPSISGNEALSGGAVAVVNGSPVIHCCDMLNNTASVDGGAVYVEDGNFSAYYANVQGNSAGNSGGAICVKATNTAVNVMVDSGVIKYNTSVYGGGIAVTAVGTSVATIDIGNQECCEIQARGEESDHSHPDISLNIAETEGGGLYFISENNNGIVFTMWCGYIGDNTANDKIPTGNIIQEGGTTTIYGAFAIENATVSNGAYLRPTLGESTIEIIYHYEISGDSASDGDTTKVTVAVGQNENMFINLPSADPRESLILVRWELKSSDGTVLRAIPCGDKLILNEATVGESEELNFYAVWMAMGAGYAEPPIISLGEHYAHMDSGSSFLYSNINDPFTVQYEISLCNPADFGVRYLHFNGTLPKDTVIIMIDINTDGINSYYFYNIIGDETLIYLNDFSKMGAPGIGWESTQESDTTGQSSEEFLFIFDFSRAESALTGTLQISMTREFVEVEGEEVRAPWTQVVSCAMNEDNLPEISHSGDSVMIGAATEIVYDPGIAMNKDSLYYGKQASLVIKAASGSLPSECYIIYGEVNYYVNYDGVIVIPIGVANTDKNISLIFESESLRASAGKISLTFELRITTDENRPLVSPKFSECTVTYTAESNPSANLSMEERLFYTDNLPATVDVSVSVENTDGCTVTLKVLKYTGTQFEYESVTEAPPVITCNTELSSETLVVATATLTLTDSSAGTYRVFLTVSDASGVRLTVPYNFIILER